MTANWQVMGKIGCRLHKEQGSMTFKWQQNGDLYQARFSTAFGRRIHLEGSSDDFRITDQRGHSYDAEAAQRYLNEQFRINLPIRFLPYWLRARPAPSPKFQATETGFRQADWQISWQQPEAGDDQPMLPRLLELSSADVSCRIVLRGWQQKPSDNQANAPFYPHPCPLPEGEGVITGLPKAGGVATER